MGRAGPGRRLAEPRWVQYIPYRKHYLLQSDGFSKEKIPYDKKSLLLSDVDLDIWWSWEETPLIRRKMEHNAGFVPEYSNEEQFSTIVTNTLLSFLLYTNSLFWRAVFSYPTSPLSHRQRSRSWAERLGFGSCSCPNAGVHTLQHWTVVRHCARYVLVSDSLDLPFSLFLIILSGIIWSFKTEPWNQNCNCKQKADSCYIFKWVWLVLNKSTCVTYVDLG
jgi:hypothetical protein